MRLEAWKASVKLAILSGLGATRGATDGGDLLLAEFFFHGGEMMPLIHDAFNLCRGMVNFEQFQEKRTVGLRVASLGAAVVDVLHRQVQSLLQCRRRYPAGRQHPGDRCSLIVSSFFHDPHSGLAEVLACFFPLILWRTVGGLLFELISLSLSFISFCSFL
jgi:hypothetical protein